jgi:spoIIIJ-associated protein
VETPVDAPVGRIRRSRARRERRPEPPRETAPETPPARAEQNPGETEPGDTHSDEKAVRETLDRMFGLLGLDLSAKTGVTGNSLRAEIDGADRKMLVQKDGQLISALQFLLNRMARRAWPGLARIQLQCEGYRDKRDEELIELVREVARQVQQTGKAKALHPMNPYERRLAHLTVREFPGLSSHSRGGGFMKKVTVAAEGPGNDA